MTNLEIREAITKANIKHYELAEMLGITEWTLSRKLRKELPDDEKEKILDVIKMYKCGVSFSSNESELGEQIAEFFERICNQDNPIILLQKAKLSGSGISVYDVLQNCGVNVEHLISEYKNTLGVMK